MHFIIHPPAFLTGLYDEAFLHESLTATLPCMHIIHESRIKAELGTLFVRLLVSWSPRSFSCQSKPCRCGLCGLLILHAFQMLISGNAIRPSWAILRMNDSPTGHAFTTEGQGSFLLLHLRNLLQLHALEQGRGFLRREQAISQFQVRLASDT